MGIESGGILEVVKVVSETDFPADFKQGALNIMQPAVLPDGQFVFVRKPREQNEIEPTLSGLDYEYTQTGFFQNGGGYRLRTLEEQAIFADKCKGEGIMVAGVEFVEGLPIVQVIAGQTLSSYLKQDDPDLQIVDSFLTTILESHEKGVVLGDRWSKNTIIKPDGGIVHIDFDIELNGLNIPEFEMAQAIYYASLANGDGEVMEVLGRWKQDVLSISCYDMEKLHGFIVAHEQLSQTYPEMKP